MQNNNKPIVTALMPHEVAALYGVSKKTLSTWLSDYADEIGRRISRYFTTLQVKTIFDCIGPPPGKYKRKY